ncbi:MAG: phenylacetate--CoA ligase family protein [Rhodospirillaceae bacterium]|nr:phenylacetate--CoA ligase family protein [Rhodospirillaceae bacterium]MBT3629014.1 phenylacetate--CoA ligase family protein [Rhodospirillaceae bacterium]MBT3928404.1 phenylacetate--CoA ligase family protein [Rhodospirillaceae bacterium]MBT4428760.1 phenylacetate--CoA ligase family protein [Rhodospirillaceae bacterium]MBT5677466.1 phenylacetate--CoA ligase family protein [Rhodospirillaceae bacterium]
MSQGKETKALDSLEGIHWPRLPGVGAQMMRPVLAQLKQAQWLPPEALVERQLQQLQSLLSYAQANVPYYQRKIGSDLFDPLFGLTLENWRKLPILRRSDIQDNAADLLSRNIPASHYPLGETQTSGSTGQPVKVTSTSASRLFWSAVTMRDHYWHRRDFSGKLCSIRAIPADSGSVAKGQDSPNWGWPAAQLYKTGAASILSLGTDVSAQAEWLAERNPEYLLTYPANLAALEEHFRSSGRELPNLKEIRTVGEMVSKELRRKCRETWGVPLSDVYSSQEVGYMALQCPESGLLHVQSETMMVEVLDEAGKPTPPGEVGRVVVTGLHNFAMPLIRYEIRDYAEPGELCSCGRGLPTLRRVVGRLRNMLVLPNGDKRWPLTGFHDFRDIAPIRQYQLVQKSVERIEVRYVVDRPLTAEEEEKLRAVIQNALGHPFELSFQYFDELTKTSGGKFEEFISEVAA